MALATITHVIEPTAFAVGARANTSFVGWSTSFDMKIYAIRATQARSGHKTVVQFLVDGVQQGGDLTLNNATTRKVTLSQGYFVPANAQAEIRFRESTGVAVTVEADYETSDSESKV